MDSIGKKKIISLPLVIAMVINPAIAELPPQAALIENTQRLAKNQQHSRHASASVDTVRRYNTDIVVDEQTRRELRAAIKESSNGTTVIDIAEASARGVSHNQFTAFNVDENGVILNNSLTPVLTQLGGWTDGNRRLTGGEARIILTEVTGATRSNLLGAVEVAGQSAEFVLANANGITCNGCGFINIPKATLVTGSAVMLNGDIAGFNLGSGSFIAEGGGLYASNLDRVDIVTRAAQINADLYAKELNIFTGNNYFDFQDSTVSSTDGAVSNATPQVALDVSALGGMYAQRIYLVGTEKGLGVNSEGLIHSVESLEITADGDVRVKNAMANDAISLASAAGSVETFGQVYSDSVTLVAEQDIINTAFLAAGSSLSMAGSSIDQRGELYAGLVDGELSESVDFTLNIHQQFSNTGSFYLADDLLLNVESFINDTGELSVLGNVQVSSETDFSNNLGVINIEGDIASIQAQSINNTEGRITYLGEDELLLEAQSSLNNQAGEIYSMANLDIQAG